MDALKSQCLETSTLENEKVLIDMDTSMPGDFNAGEQGSVEEIDMDASTLREFNAGQR